MLNALYDKLVATSNPFNDINNNAQLKKFKEYLSSGESSVIRCFAEGSSGNGHQSATANLVYRILAPNTAQTILNFDYNGKVEVYYDGGDKCLQKLRKQFNFKDDQDKGCVYSKDGNDNVFLIDIKNGTPKGTANFGFTGGADFDPKSKNFTEILNVNYFLCVQPYNWGSPEVIQFRDKSKSTLDLLAVKAIGGQSFRWRSYYIPEGRFSEAVGLEAVDDNERLIKWIFDKKQLSDFKVMVTYGLRNPPCEINKKPQEAIAILLGALMTWQKDAVGAYQGAKPVIVINLDELDKECVDLAIKLLGGEKTEFETLFSQYNINYESRKRYLESISAKDRGTILYKPSLEMAESEIEKLRAKNDKVIFLQLSSVRTPFFYYAMANGSLPPLFEGQNSGNIALNVGKPYLHSQSVFRLQSKSDFYRYPSTFLSYYNPYSTPNYMQWGANMVNNSLDEGKATAFADSCNSLGAKLLRTITNENDDNGPYRYYFKNLKTFFANASQDKFTVGIAYLSTLIPELKSLKFKSIGVESDNKFNYMKEGLNYNDIAGADDENPLDKLNEKLKSQIVIGQPMDLIPGVLTAGLIKDFYSDFLKDIAGSLKFVVSSYSCEPKGAESGLTSINISGTTDIFSSIGINNARVDIEFTNSENKLQMLARFTDTEMWTMPEVPWIEFDDLFFEILVSDNPWPSQVKLGGNYKPANAALSTQIPGDKNQWMLNADLDPAKVNINSLFQMATSVNLIQTMPQPLNSLANIGVSNVGIAFDLSKNILNSLSFNVQNVENDLPLVGNIKINNFKVHVLMFLPKESRSVYVNASSQFTIGSDEDAGVITLTADYPDYVFNGTLTKGEIKLKDLLSLFLPDSVTLNPPSLPVIDEFKFNYDKTNDSMSVSMNFNIDWDFKFPFTDKTLFSINDVGFEISRNKSVNTGSVTGSMVLFNDTPEPLKLSVGSFYKGKSKWQFIAQQIDGVFDINTILKAYLDWDNPVSMPKIDGLKLELEWDDSNEGNGGKATEFEFAAKTASPWKPIPCIDLSVAGTIKIGYGKLPDQKDEVKGRYGELTADVNLWNIDLAIAYNFNPKVNVLEIKWLSLKAVVKSGKDIDTTATFSLSGYTLGQMVETFISWATGSKYGLSAPWSILNQLSLNGLEVVYNFTKKQVSFQINIGSIDFGLFSIDAIGLSYDPENSNQKVNIELTGKFVWDKGASKQSWDPTKPETAPVPPGGGNKYLDLRLLAAGQHVTVKGLTEQKNVKDVITMLRDLKVPNPPEIPVGGEGQPIFAPDNSWFVAMDFGVLKTGDSKENAANIKYDKSYVLPVNKEEEPSASNYFIQMSMVFNDPLLYGMRIALAGPMAKVFDGLDFQIMYRQVSETVGCYSSEITLPNIMRKIQIGVATLTLPSFAVQVYTNGDFFVDIGFPWNQDFSKSFAIEAIIPPGIPVMGSGGFYFGKLSSSTTDKVPKTTLGWFNPVLVFGVGLQLGLGKSVDFGILSGGFSLTVFGILEGVIARWLPYNNIIPDNNKNDLQAGYYFSLTGTLGIQGCLYGSVDFAIIKADVNVNITLFIRASYASYADIPITAKASVCIKVNFKINLGIFKITLHFSFSASIEATFILSNPSGTNAPWNDKINSPKDNLLLLRHYRSLKTQKSISDYKISAFSDYADAYKPEWSRLQKGNVLYLKGYVAPVLTAAGDGASSLADQKVCYAVNMFLQTQNPVQVNNGLLKNSAVKNASEDIELVEAGKLAHAALARSRRLKYSADRKVLKSESTINDYAAVDSEFEDLVVRVLQWIIAAGGTEDIAPDALNTKIISDSYLKNAINYLNDSGATPVPNKAILDFLDLQTQMTFSLNQEEGSSSAVFFPMPPSTHIDISGGNGQLPLSYSFGKYNSCQADYLSKLNEYFNQLKVKFQEEQSKERAMQSENDDISIATYIFSDYFNMLGKQALQALRDGLRNFKYLLKDGKTSKDIISDINATGQLNDTDAYTVAELFAANAGHLFTYGSNQTVLISNMKYQTPGGLSLNDISKLQQFNASFSALVLAEKNKDNAKIITDGIKIVYGNSNSYVTKSGDSLTFIASMLNVSLEELLLNTNVLSNNMLIKSLAVIDIPDFSHKVSAGDSLNVLIAQYGVSMDSLANANADIVNLFSSQTDPNLNVPYLPQYEIGELIDEAIRTLAFQHLGSMASRYYLHGLRLPTDGLTPNIKGLFVIGDKPEGYKYPDELGLFALTGQMFALPNIQDPVNIKNSGSEDKFSFTLTRGAEADWLNFDNADSSKVTFTLDNENDYLRYKSLKSYITNQVFNAEIIELSPLSNAASQLSRFPVSQEIPWQIPFNVTLSKNTVVPVNPRPRLWSLPNALVSFPDNGSVKPYFEPVIAKTDHSSGTTVDGAVNNYGFGTLIQFSVRKTAMEGNCPTSARTYEIIGAADGDIILLEKIIDQIQNDNDRIKNILLLYKPNSTSSDAKGWQSDNPSVGLMGIAKVNLSTDTNPKSDISELQQMALDVDSMTSVLKTDEESINNIINEKMEFIRLLWEASITRSGGFYLNYNNGIDSTEPQGLPDYVFNDHNEASLALLVFYNDKNENEGLPLSNYMNVLATNEAFDLNDAALIAQAVQLQQQTVILDKKQTIKEIADEYYMSICELAGLNASVLLNESLQVKVSGGLYQVNPSGDAPGNNVSAIAAYFNTTVKELKDANVDGALWQDTLPYYKAIKLPLIVVSAKNQTLAGLADYYHTTVKDIVLSNLDLSELFAVSSSLTVKSGELSTVPTLQTGTAGFSLQRKASIAIPDDPNASDWGQIYLSNMFNLLGYRISENAYFKQSNYGLPIGPQSDNQATQTDKIMAAYAQTDEDIWNYTRTVSYFDVSKNNSVSGNTGNDFEGAESQYAGIGGILQFELAWLDIFGNKILSNWDIPSKESKAVINNVPQIISYGDLLIGLDQWTSVTSDYRVAPNTNGDPSVEILLDFDKSDYDKKPNAQGYIYKDNDFIEENGLKGAWEDKINLAIAKYNKILNQLLDPNGIKIEFVTSIVMTQESLFSDAQVADIIKWVQSIRKYLTDLLLGKPTDDFVSYLELSINLDIKDINPEQIFEVNAFIIIKRNSYLVAGEMADVTGAVSSVTQLVPWTGALSDDEQSRESYMRFKTDAANDGEPEQRDLNAFADGFTRAFKKLTDFDFQIATGTDRFSNNQNAQIWAVQLGKTSSTSAESKAEEIQAGISYKVNNENNPKIYAPRPISTALSSNPLVKIIPYETGKEININDNYNNKSFTTIDLDQWLSCILNKTDELLSLRYVAPALVLRSKLPNDKNALDNILTAKKNLAQAMKTLMIPVYDDEIVNDQELAAVQENFYQSMLGLLGNCYTVKAGIQFSADVQSAIKKLGDSTLAPCLYGNLSVNKNLGISDELKNISLSTPKLRLKFSDDSSTNPHYLSFLMSSTALDSKIVHFDLSYSGQYIEHEIGELNGIDGYRPSSWLSFVTDISQQWPLEKELGNFDVPVILREYPSTPSLIGQEQLSYMTLSRIDSILPKGADISLQTEGDYNPLKGLLNWIYGFSYSMPVHYEQDTVNGKLQFNNMAAIKTMLLSMDNERTLFDNLAQFIEEYPKVQKDLDLYLVDLDVTTKDEVSIKNAQEALMSAGNMLNWIGESLKEKALNFRELNDIALFVYEFEVNEGEADRLNPDGKTIKALEVTITLKGSDGIDEFGIPQLLVAPDEYVAELVSSKKGVYVYQYHNKNKEYLQASMARTIAIREFMLPGLNILQSQNVKAEIYITRNDDFSDVKKTAKEFIYTTPTVAFSNPLYPMVEPAESNQVNIATIFSKDAKSPVVRTLSSHLNNLYNAMLQDVKIDSITIQSTVYYEYSINPELELLRVPVLLMPPLSVNVNDGNGLTDMINNQVNAINAWFDYYKPVDTKGRLRIDITLMSNLTSQPLPLLKLYDMYLELIYISPKITF